MLSRSYTGDAAPFTIIPEDAEGDSPQRPEKLVYKNIAPHHF